MESKRTTSPELELIIGERINVLDHGFIRVIDYMGTDDAVVQAARVSYGTGTKQRSEDRGLIRYLMRHRHTTPFEMCEIKFHIKLPIFVARQWIRHRTANVNEYSARYSILDREFYVPEILAKQSDKNNQGRGEAISQEENDAALRLIKEFSEKAYENYLNLMNVDEEGNMAVMDRAGIARELARMVLPTNFYTQWYWKIDLHNLLHFLSLRADSHAQHEIRVYAETIAQIVKSWVPVTFEAFEDYVVNGATLSAKERKIVNDAIQEEKLTNQYDLGGREWAEFLTKLNRI
jgi:thymidylate synthase (FAD)